MELTRDMIDKRLEEAKDERESIDLMNDFSYRLLDINTELSLELSERAFESAEKFRYLRGKAFALANRGFCRFFQLAYNETLESLKQARWILENLPLEERGGLNKIINGIGCVYLEQADYSQAAIYFREALNISEESNDTVLITKIYSNLSYINSCLKKFDDSLSYSNKAIRLLKNLPELNMTYAIALNNMGDTYIKMERYEEAGQVLDEAYRLCNRRHRVMILLTMGELNFAMGNLERAEQILLTALRRTRRLKNGYWEINILGKLGRLMAAKGANRSALRYLKRAIMLADESSADNLLYDIYTQIYRIYESKGNYRSALSYFEHYSGLRERWFSLEMEKNIRNIEAESLKKANERIKIISAIGREITSILDLRRLLKTTSLGLNRLLDAKSFGIATYDRESKKIRYGMYIEGKGYTPDNSYSVDREDILAAYVIREQEEVFIGQHSELSNYLGKHAPVYVDYEEEKSHHISQSIVVIPLLLENDIIGALSVQSFKKRAYNLTDLDTLKALASYIAIALNNSRQAEMIKLKNEELKRLAITDYLTGIYNRREFEKRLRTFWSLSSEREHHFSILILDADHFKGVNDSYGHPAGDECLRLLSALLKLNVSNPDDCLARYGGEEFIILLNSPAEEALKLAEKIRGEIEELTINYEELTYKVTVSIGVSSALVSEIRDQRGPELLISRADEALYRSKEEGRNRVTFLPF